MPALNWETIGLAAGLTAGLVSAVKKLKIMDGHHDVLPFVAQAVACALVGAAVMVTPPEGVAGPLAYAGWLILHGVAAGLAASGGYDAGKGILGLARQGGAGRPSLPPGSTPPPEAGTEPPPPDAAP